jgi:hypothetical protein
MEESNLSYLNKKFKLESIIEKLDSNKDLISLVKSE